MSFECFELTYSQFTALSPCIIHNNGQDIVTKYLPLLCIVILHFNLNIFMTIIRIINVYLLHNKEIYILVI